MLLKFLSCFLLLQNVYVEVKSCGITTHTEIAHRAANSYEYSLHNDTSISQLYSKMTLFNLIALVNESKCSRFIKDIGLHPVIHTIIKKYQAAFQAGNPYPDSFYDSFCKKSKYADVSEDTHWVPFLNATINYIRRKYSRPYNEDALKLIAFTLGFASHQMADVTWHSLGIKQGFLSAMGFVNFHGSFSDAHSTGDFGGDVVNQYELDTKYISNLGTWYVPVSDLYEIYKEFYGREVLNQSDILECSSILFLGRLGEQLAVSIEYSKYNKKSVFLADKLNDYFLGGLDDMSAWTQISWNNVLWMLENGPENCKISTRSILDLNCMSKSAIRKTTEPIIARKKHPNKNRIELSSNSLNGDLSYLKTEPDGKGFTIRASEKFKNVLKLKNMLEARNEKEGEQRATSNLKQASTFSIKKDYSNLGWSLEVGDLNNDNSDDLLMSAPIYTETSSYQDGAVFAVLSNNGDPLPLINLDLKKDASITFKPPRNVKNSRFGHSVVVLDLNQDGFKDVVISAPSYGLKNKTYEGRVYVYFGNEDFKFDQPDVEITCKNYVYCNLGWSLSKGDLNGDGNDDLLIGSPYASTCGDQCGFVGVIFSGKKDFSTQTDPSKFDWLLHGTMAYEWFGYAHKVKLGYLAIGAPHSRICADSSCAISKKDKQSVGRVYVYKYPELNPVCVLVGESEFEQFGYSLDLSTQLKKNVIAIGSVTKESKLSKKILSASLNNAGVVQVFDITDTAKVSLMTTLKSDRANAAFGSKVKFFSPNKNQQAEDLYVSAPKRNEDTITFNKVEQGILFGFKGGNKFPTGNYTDNCQLTDFTPCPKLRASVIVENLEDKSMFAYDFVFLVSAKNPGFQAAISAIHSNNEKSRLNGRVNLFDTIV